jgi:hypothetical protein
VSQLKPFPKFNSHKVIAQNTPKTSDRNCKNLQYVDDDHAASSSSQSDNDIDTDKSDCITLSKSKRDIHALTEVNIKNKRMRRDNVAENFEDKENLDSGVSNGMCI